MPRDGSDVYHIPPGTEGIPDTTIESNKYNNFAHDVEQDLNTPRPIIAGGTGATSADEALTELGGEKALQLVDNYDSFVFLPGSFYSGAGATNEPVDGHSFTGICYQADANNMVVEARDMTAPYTVYVRVKTAGVWTSWSIGSAADFVLKAGDTMTGLLTLSGDPTAPLHAVPKRYVDIRAVVTSDTMPPIAATPDGGLWFESDTGLLYVLYNDGDSRQWVIAAPQPDLTIFALATDVVKKTGDTMTGHLALPTGPAAANAVRKDYVDNAVAGAAPVAATAAEYISNSAPTKMLTPGAAWTAAIPVAATASPWTPDFSAALDIVFTIQGPGLTINAPTGIKVGQKGIIYLVQPAGGNGTITTWNSVWKFPGGIKPTLTAAANAVDALSYAVKSSTEIYCTLSSGFA
jgi:hypothetical protein